MSLRRLETTLGIELPIVQAPMAGAQDAELAAAVSEAGGLGSLPCALLGHDAVRAQVATVRARTTRPFALNFFCHVMPAVADDGAWKERLARYHAELGVMDAPPAATRRPFDEETCALVEELRPPVVSFHFGLPAEALVERVRATGARIVSSATTVEEARWLEARGCDVIVAQGFEAGGHRGMFLTMDIARQVGTFALVPQVVDAVHVPVVAAGAIADARGVVAARVLGAAGVQIGTAYLACPEARVSAVHRAALTAATDDASALTNVFTGRPARSAVNRLVREVGPMSPLAPPFPVASSAVTPLRATAEAMGSGDFSPLWMGQAARLSRALPAGELTKRLWAEALEVGRGLDLG